MTAQIAYFDRSNFEHPECCDAMPDGATMEDYVGDGYYILKAGKIYLGAYKTLLDAQDTAGAHAEII